MYYGGVFIFIGECVLIRQAQTLLLMPGLLGYIFTGDRVSEYTNVTTTNLFDCKEKNRDYETIRLLVIPKSIFTPIDRAETLRGNMFTGGCRQWP